MAKEPLKEDDIIGGEDEWYLLAEKRFDKLKNWPDEKHYHIIGSSIKSLNERWGKQTVAEYQFRRGKKKVG